MKADQKERRKRRTLSFRSRKNSTGSLSIRGSQFIKVSGQKAFSIVGLPGHTFETKDPLPENIKAVHFVEVQDSRRSKNAPLGARRYKLRVAVAVTGAKTEAETTPKLEHFDAVDDGLRSNWTFADGAVYRFRETHPGRDVKAERSIRQRKRKSSRRKFKYAQACLKRSRKRNAEKKRQFNRHAIEHLDKVQPLYMCLEGKSLKNLMARARGTGRTAKAQLNQTFALAGLGELARVLANQCEKRGVEILFVPPAGSSQTCPGCGYRHQKNRESQASFRCRSCGWAGNADHSAALILRNRGYVRTVERLLGFTPPVQAAPTGWLEQPSSLGECSPPESKRTQAEPLRDESSDASSKDRIRRDRPDRPGLDLVPETGLPKASKAERLNES